MFVIRIVNNTFFPKTFFFEIFSIFFFSNYLKKKFSKTFLKKNSKIYMKICFQEILQNIVFRKNFLQKIFFENFFSQIISKESFSKKIFLRLGCCFFFSSPPCLRRWFHGKITREQAERLLNPPETGLFLVRESTNYPGDYTLCVSCDGKVEHYRIIYHNGKLTIDEEEYFENLMQLVEVRAPPAGMFSTQQL